MLTDEQREALEYADYALRQMTSVQSDDARSIIAEMIAARAAPAETMTQAERDSLEWLDRLCEPSMYLSRLGPIRDWVKRNVGTAPAEGREIHAASFNFDEHMQRAFGSARPSISTQRWLREAFESGRVFERSASPKPADGPEAAIARLAKKFDELRANMSPEAQKRVTERVAGVREAVDERAAFEEIRSALDETYGFAATSPRARENINFIYEKLDEIEQARAALATAPTMREAVRGAHSAQALLHEAACECMSPEQTDKYEALFVGADDLPLRFLRCILKRIDRAGAST